MTNVERLISEYLTISYGDDMDKMVAALNEKHKMFRSAYAEYSNRKTVSTKKELVNALSEFQSILTQISVLYGLDCDTLNMQTLINEKNKKNGMIPVMEPLKMGDKVRRIVKLTSSNRVSYKDGRFIRYVNSKKVSSFSEKMCYVYFEGNKVATIVPENELLRINTQVY
jgi:hypothetical protein